MLLFLLPLFGAIKTESYPPKLTPEEEKNYLDLFINHQDKNARAKLIEHNLRLVAHIAKKYENTFEDKDGNEVELLDLLEDKSIDILANYEKKALNKDLNEALKTLTSREFDIISRRYGIGRQLETQKEIATKLNISRSYVSRIEKRALLKLYLLLKK